MKKKIIIGLIAFLSLLIILDLFVFRPWNNDINTTTNSNTAQEDLEYESNDESEVSNTTTGNSNFQEETDAIIETDLVEKDVDLYFLNDNNEYASIYVEGFFENEPFEIFEEELSTEEANEVNKILGMISRVVHSNEDESILTDYVEGITYNSGNRHKLNGFMTLFSDMDEYAIRNSFKVSENVFYLNIFITEVMGDALEGTEVKSALYPATYNISTGVLSFNETYLRYPVQLIYEDDKFKVHCYMIESTTTSTSLYMVLSHKLSHEVLGQDFPKLKAVIDTEDEQKLFMPISIPLYDMIPYLPGETLYLKGNTMYVIDSISDIVFEYGVE